MKKIISIVGCTGIGKTALSIALANSRNTEILSCDSRQFYREISIGTAKPSDIELAMAKHHFINNLSIENSYSIGKYEVEAIEKIEEIFKTKDEVILVGGSMMYEKAILQGLNDLPTADPENQKKLNHIWQTEGIEALQELLKSIDEPYYSVVDLQNPRRLMRAIDVFWQTNSTFTEITAKDTQKRNFETIRIGIDAPREIIYQKINQRVDKMMENGLLDEAKAMLPYKNTQALQTVGYKELFLYLEGNCTLDFAVEEIKKTQEDSPKDNSLGIEKKKISIG